MVKIAEILTFWRQKNHRRTCPPTREDQKTTSQLASKPSSSSEGTKDSTNLKTKLNPSTNALQPINEPMTFVLPDQPNNEPTTFVLPDIVDIRPFVDQQSPLSLLRLLQQLVASNSTSQHPSKPLSNTPISVSVLPPSLVSQSTKGKGKRTIDQSFSDHSSYVSIGSSLPNSHQPFRSLPSHLAPPSSAPLPAADLNEPHHHPTQPDLVHQPQPAKKPRLLLAPDPPLLHGLPAHIWSNIFALLDVEPLLYLITNKPDSSSKKSIDDCPSTVLKHALESQSIRHNLVTLSRTLSPIASRYAWSFLILNSSASIRSVARRLEHQSHLAAYVQTCCICLHSNHDSNKTPAKTLPKTPARTPRNNNRKSLLACDSSVAATGNGSSKKTTPRASIEDRRVQHHKSPRIATPSPETTDDDDQNTMSTNTDLPSLLLSISSTLVNLAISAPDISCTRALKTLTGLSSYLISLENLNLQGSREHDDFYSLATFLDVLPRPSRLENIAISSFDPIIAGSRPTTPPSSKLVNTNNARTSSFTPRPILIDSLYLGQNILLTPRDLVYLTTRLSPKTLSIHLRSSSTSADPKKEEEMALLKESWKTLSADSRLKEVVVRVDWWRPIDREVLEGSLSLFEGAFEFKVVRW